MWQTAPLFSVSNQVHQIPIYVADGPTFFSIKSSTPNTYTYICGRRPHFFQYQIKYTKYLYMWQTAPLFSVSNQVHQIPIYVRTFFYICGRRPHFFQYQIKYTKYLYMWQTAPLFSVSNQVHQIPIYVADGPTFFSIKSSTPNTYICGDGPTFFSNVCYLGYLNFKRTLFINNGTKKKCCRQVH